jgi:TetR/AcrR family transcriptional regulator
VVHDGGNEKRGQQMRGSSTPAGRHEILQAATREFADRGYSGATTSGIARRAGVTQPLVHHHFGSKQGLWSAVLETLFTDLDELLSTTLQRVQDADRRTRLEALLRTLVVFSGKRSELARLIRTESSVGGEPFDELFERWLKRWIDFFENEVRAAVDDGVARPMDPRLAYFAIIGASTEIFAEPMTALRAFGLDVSQEEHIQRYADLVVHLVLRGLLQDA